MMQYRCLIIFMLITSMLACTPPCSTCQGSDTFCLTCSDTLRSADISSGQCLCNSGYVEILNICQQCLSPCKECSIDTQKCDNCLDQNMNLNNNQCICKTGYLSQGNQCLECVSMCLECSGNQYYCTSCAYNLTPVNGICVCKTSDILQLSGTWCLCRNIGWLNFDGTTCKPTCIEGCNSCNEFLKCTSCSPINYYMESINCKKCLSWCKMCQNSQVCDVCHDNYFLNDQLTCTACCSGCKTCPNQNCGECIACQGRYYLDNGYCPQCQSPCWTCTSDTFCLSCDQQLAEAINGECFCISTSIKLNGICTDCQDPCWTCENTRTHCTSCTDALMLLNDGICTCPPDIYVLQINRCNPCTPPCKYCLNSVTYCTDCLDISTLQSNNTCKCPDGYTFVLSYLLCKTCTLPCINCINFQNYCTSCVDQLMYISLGRCICYQGYVEINQQCLKCDDQCLTCIDTQSNCVECVDVNMDLSTQPKCQCKFGYYQSSPQQCTQCIDPCETCVGIGTFCLSCSRQNQILLNNQCRCLDGYAEVESQCQLCILPCSACAGPLTSCTSCIDPIQSLISGTCNCPSNYYYDSLLCQICQLPCVTCQGSSTFCLNCNDELMELNNQNQCSCKSGYFQNNYKCEKCMDGCEYCSDNSTCILCYYNYMLNQQAVCEKCMEPCQTCEISTNICKSCLNPKLKAINNVCQCLSSEYFFEDYCYPCSNYCQSCTSTGCTQCFDFNNLQLIDGNCLCQEGYLDNGSGCQICNSYCQTCQSDVNQCTKCFETQNRFLKGNYCICSNGYFDDGNLDCIKCTDISGIDRKECNYKNCKDGIFTWGEQCDDGNSIPKDGCTNCLIDHGYQCINQILYPSICQTCSLNCADCDEYLNCNKCDDGYYLLDQRCLICQNVCQTCDVFSECITCKYIEINGQCSTCDRKIGYVLDDQSQKCISICGDGIQSDIEQCDDGNLLNGDGCDKYCKLETGYVKLGSVIIYRQPLKPQVNEIIAFQNIYQPNRTFILNYNYQLQNSTIDLLKYINISITNKQLQFDYNINLVNLSDFGNDGINFTLKIDLKLKNSINQEKLIIQFTKPSQFVAFNRIKQTVKEINIVISQFQFIDQAAKDNQKNIMNFNSSILYIMGGLVLVGVLTGGISVFYSILDIIQLVSYLRYINTDFPYNLDEFFNLFKFAQSSQLNDYIQIQNAYDYIYTYIDESQIVDPPEKIANDGFSTNILLNIQPILQVWIIFFILYLISLVLYHIVLKYRISHREQTGYTTDFKYFIKGLVLRTSLNFKNQFFWSIFLRTFYSTAYDLSFIIILNLASYSNQPGYYINYIGELVSICLLSAYFIIIFKQLGIFTRREYISIELNNQFGSVKEGLRFNRYSIYFNTFNLLKKMLFMMALLFLYDIPLLQTTSILILNSLTVFYLLIFKPLDQQDEFIKQSASEIFTTSVQIQITGLVIDNQIQILTYDQRSFLGWCAIGAIILMIVTQIMVAFSQQLKIYIKLINKIKNNLIKLMSKYTQNGFKANQTIMSKI